MLDELNARYRKVLVGGTNAKNFVLDTQITDSVRLFTPVEFKRFENQQPIVALKGGAKIAGAEWWLRNSTGWHEALEVAPPPLELSRPRNFNLWQEGFAIEPDASVSWGLLHDHMLKILCSGDESHFEWLLNWLRCLVQKPGLLPGSAIVLRGPKGGGKGVFARSILGLFHPRHAIHIFGQKQLVEN